MFENPGWGADADAYALGSDVVFKTGLGLKTIFSRSWFWFGLGLDLGRT